MAASREAAGELRAAGPAPDPGKATFVAVSATPCHAADPAFAPRPTERRAIARRVRDEALGAAAEGAPLWLSAIALTVLAGVVTLAPSARRDAWACLVLGAAAAWFAIGWIRVPLRAARLNLERRRRAFTTLGAVILFALALLPWLPGAQEPVAVRAIVLGLGTCALAAAATFGSMRGLAAIAVALPISALFAAEWQGPLAAPTAPGMRVVALLASAIAGVTALASHRLWLRRTRRAMENEDRILDLKAARDLALRADQDKSRFLAIASHDLRQPVHALGLFAATLEKRLEATAEEPLVRNVVRSIDGLDRLFNAMLDISRLDAGTIEPNFQHFPLRDLFRRLHMQFAGHAESAGLSLRFSPGGKSVKSDPQLLERILGNLIQNAIKYTEVGGIVVVVRTTATHYNVEVWDTGVGIRAAELPRVFDEFYQVRRRERVRMQGLGMGLAIVKRLARLLDHGLTVVSRPGRGTLFRISIAQGGLPEIQDVTAAADTLPMPALQPRTVLIVDDEEAIRESLSMLLEEWGYQAHSAATLEEAVQLVQALELPPDLILSDLHLGDGADGIAVIDAVRRACGCDVPAILITGDTSHEEMRRATDSAHPVLFKPVQPRKLLNSLRGLLS